MKAAELRQSILQAAVQGKLVPQNPQDEPASELLRRIQQEKAQLIKEGKLKKETPLPSITEDEVPFDLPDGWVWCRLGNLGDVQSSKRVFVSEFVDNGIPFYRGTEVGALSTGEKIIPKYHITEQHYNDLIQHTGKPIIGDLLMPSICPDGRIWLVDTDEPFYFKDGRVLWVHLVENYLNNRYIQQALKARLISGYKNIASGTTFAELKIFLLKEIAIPLPPLHEQNLIIAKLDELLALCDALEAEEKKLDALESHFTEYLPKSILQAAVQGKLVPQNSHDEPASEFLKRMQQEKVQLIKEGKLKKEKPLPPISKDEIPYDLPEGWEWCRLGAISNYGNTQSVSTDEISDDSWVLELEDVEKGTGKLLTKKRKSQRVPQSTKHRFQPNDILYSKLRPYLNKVLIAEEFGYCTSEILPLTFYKELNIKYTLNYLRSPLFVDYANRCSYGVKMPRLGTNDGKLALVPLPPIEEQKRIVAKVDDLLALCDEMKVAYAVPVASNEVAKIIPFPTPSAIDCTEESAEPLLLAARGDAENLSSEALKAIDDLFAEDAE